jgi:hypothetical protein
MMYWQSTPLSGNNYEWGWVLLIRDGLMIILLYSMDDLVVDHAYELYIDHIMIRVRQIDALVRIFNSSYDKEEVS